MTAMHSILSPAARALLAEAYREGKASTKGRRAAVAELAERGRLISKRGKGILTPAGRFDAGKEGAA
ncbi:hypothetical protein F8A10_12205 [Paracoccus kondratievae]|uniref:hypothetical protein n=1 Tax=Paracoccus kondratievae TaxID=135740 RepID=UPI0012667407|nr:hypothetical protein [Paracoccus kondratievae]QFQ88273.1 hypothetical protein F8A10_12205 [Paracoccus kondratievae]